MRIITLAFIILLLFAITITYVASKFPILPFDLMSYHELREEATPAFSILMQAVSYLGEAPSAAALVALSVAFFASRRQWAEAIFMLSTACSSLLAFILKDIVHRARPFPLAGNATGLLESINQYSYPSGHVLFFVVFFGFFTYLSWLHFSGRSRIIAIAVSLSLIALIGPSRIFLGAHWASDVVGSYVIGTIWLTILIIAYRRAGIRGRDREQVIEKA
jgi:undecaprenyl-diphosphatase